ncbi:glycosyltransferase family 39 protein [Candidatus Woesearchaeota archaeon]|nr:glycosyltransferase family 39 protein [Candidatus Woesearchaeota archaeon]
MSKYEAKRKEKDKIYRIILFTAILIFTVLVFYKIPFYNEILWDSAVYVETGKYIFSLGSSGIWESVRPLVWPLILGAVWKIGLDPVVFGKLIVFLMGVGIVYLTYILGKDIFDRKIGLLAAVFTAFTPTFLLTNSQLLTAIPSTFFAVLGFYLFVKKKYFYSGLLLGIAFMTRFLQLFVFILLVIYLLIFYFRKKEKLKNILMIGAGFLIPVIPYLILNTILYGNPIHPFLLQSYMAKYTGWFWWEPLSFYFVNLFKENFLVLFAIPAFYFLFKKKDKEKLLVLLLFLVYFIYYNSIIHKEMRFLVTLFPYLFLITAYGLGSAAGYIKNKAANILVLIILVVIFLITAYPQIKTEAFNENLKIYYEYLEPIDRIAAIYTTSPLYLLETNKRAELIYYPTFDSARAKKMQEEILEAEHILFNQCDIQCPPWDEGCPAEKEEFIGVIKDNFEEIHYIENNGCAYFIYAS